jgi:hypothetical protein
MELDEHTFKDAVRTYIELYDEIMKVSKEVREMRRKSTELSQAILQFMSKNKIDEFQLSDGKLCRRTSKRTQSLHKDHIIDTLKCALGSQEKVDKIITEMNANRKVIESECLRRTRQGKTTATV